ncbi:hypothetical protein IQ240_22515 [Nodularia sp. LEGE 04288]|uniref:ribbon-helix-helix domain-containing protein n=1 Tax=unclassified Nodularia (in: cyanobacteria) TaxID=2656917 RepID=UPI001D12541F|nr:hypothetical protein [Nodularia sp. UHCC 0506]MCC2695337.1 hypothetical protein [Nodularia sp. LEGE 04288]MEA5515740.1 hypothetical protein [Nodularia sp. UHCC 0506]
MTSDRYKGKRQTVTFPEEMYDTIERLSKEETRNFSQQVVHLCGEALKARNEANTDNK